MIINSITLKNFRSYEDETTFSFSPKGNKNIVLIGGENGAGKSTLFEAIKLCIYGPIIYGYLGKNHNYITRIKNNINDNAYKNKEIESFIKNVRQGTSLLVDEIYSGKAMYGMMDIIKKQNLTEVWAR